jgi:regulator of sigma E protease
LGQLGNVHRLGVLGISRSMAPGDIKTEKAAPLRAIVMGAQETWFVVDRTLSYITGVFAGREAADQLGGPIRIAQVSGQVATAGFAPLIHLTAVLSVSIGLLNLFSNSSARWRSPFVLRHRDDLRPALVRACTGTWLPYRAGDRPDVDDFATFNDILHLATS